MQPDAKSDKKSMMHASTKKIGALPPAGVRTCPMVALDSKG